LVRESETEPKVSIPSVTVITGLGLIKATSRKLVLKECIYECLESLLALGCQGCKERGSITFFSDLKTEGSGWIGSNQRGKIALPEHIQ